jgi:hypothetical protein
LSFKDPTQPLRDILEGAGMIEDFTLGMSFEQFREDPKTVAAVERKFLVIGEAAVRLGREAALIRGGRGRGGKSAIWVICSATPTTRSIWKSSGRQLRTTCRP